MMPRSSPIAKRRERPLQHSKPSRRSWRVGQKSPVRVYFLYYQGTLQEKALLLMGEKLLAAETIEGRGFSDEGLAALAGGGDDIVVALGKALVEGLDGIESAEEIWAARRRAAQDAGFAVEAAAEPAATVPTPHLPAAASGFSDLAALAAAVARRKKKAKVAAGQLALF